MPTNSDPASPGPRVTAIASTSPNCTPASLNASDTTGLIASMCARDATSGNTPPYGACSAICDATTFDRIVSPSRTMAAAVSSHEVSMPRISVIPGSLSLYPPVSLYEVRGLVPSHSHPSDLWSALLSRDQLPFPPCGGKGLGDGGCALAFQLDHQVIRAVGQHFHRAGVVQQHRVFDANAVAARRVIQPRLDGEHVPTLQPVARRPRREERRFVHVQPQPVRQ